MKYFLSKDGKVVFKVSYFENCKSVISWMVLDLGYFDRCACPDCLRLADLQTEISEERFKALVGLHEIR